MYNFSSNTLHDRFLESQAYDSLCTDQVILTNTGKVPLDFCLLGTSDAEELLPGQVAVFPPMVYSLYCKSVFTCFF